MKKFLAWLAALVFLFSCGTASAEITTFSVVVDDTQAGTPFGDSDNPDAFVNVVQRYNAAVRDISTLDDLQQTSLMDVDAYYPRYDFINGKDGIIVSVKLSEATANGAVTAVISRSTASATPCGSFLQWTALVMALDKDVSETAAMSVVREACIEFLEQGDSLSADFGKHECCYIGLAGEEWFIIRNKEYGTTSDEEP